MEFILRLVKNGVWYLPKDIILYSYRGYNRKIVFSVEIPSVSRYLPEWRRPRKSCFLIRYCTRTLFSHGCIRRWIPVSYPTLKVLGFLVLRGLRLANRHVRLLSRYGDSHHWCSFCFPHPTLSFFTPMLLLQNGFQDTLRISNTLEHDICPPTSGDMKISVPDDSLPPSTVRAYNGDVVVTDENIFPSPETVPDHNPVRH